MVGVIAQNVVDLVLGKLRVLTVLVVDRICIDTGEHRGVG